MPLVHSMRITKVKNASLALGDAPEPTIRVEGGESIVADADRLIANTDDKACELIALYDDSTTAATAIEAVVKNQSKK